MSLLNKYHTLFVSIIAILAITLAGSHFCPTPTHASNSHTKDHNVTNSILYSGTFDYQPCCANNNSEQIIFTPKQIQKFNSDIQNQAATTLFTLLNFAPKASGGPLYLAVTGTSLDPGGKFILRC